MFEWFLDLFQKLMQPFGAVGEGLLWLSENFVWIALILIVFLVLTARKKRERR